MTMIAVMAMVAGGALITMTAPLLQALGWPTIPSPGASDPAAMSAWWGFSFARLTAFLLFSAGAIVWTVRDSVNPSAERRLIGLLAVILCGLSAMIGIQTIAIWSSTAGWVVFAGLFALALTGAWTLKHSAHPA